MSDKKSGGESSAPNPNQGDVDIVAALKTLLETPMTPGYTTRRMIVIEERIFIMQEDPD